MDGVTCMLVKTKKMTEDDLISVRLPSGVRSLCNEGVHNPEMWTLTQK